MDAMDEGRSEDALRRRLRDDPAAAARLDELRRAAFSRDGDEAVLVDVPQELQLAAGGEPGRLPAPMVRLLTEEARLRREGQALLALERSHLRAAAASASASAPPDEVDTVEAEGHRSAPPASPGPTSRPERSGAALVPWYRRLLRPVPLAAVAAGMLAVGALGALSSTGVLMQDDSWRLQAPTASPRAASTSSPEVPADPPPPFTALPPVDEPLAAEETAKALEASAAANWEMAKSTVPGAVRPDVSVERIVSADEWGEQQVACLAEAGIAATSSRDGFSYTGGDPVAAYACTVRFPTRPEPPASDAMLAYVHDYYVSYLIPCYASEGEPYEGEVPDTAAFVAGVRSGEYWSPLPAQLEPILQSRCPEVPPAMR
ncbi:hypothetical protein QFZ62_001483 [Clavibacter sp. B3I6]|uniref:hypothetical protein n=1 Tax=Clavibacter sp. B3I6 TaxID=3042268 RepID=UPI00277D42DB|nr:hypothetical protein [Clavibacter sp. B3I6]MDQ0744175.1 hypothetical protein [Clavibacter sp. B3I6]